jgi:hypothetical protein
MYTVMSRWIDREHIFFNRLRQMTYFLVFSMTLSLMHQVKVTHASVPRLAVLELQGELGTLSQRQAWTDSIRRAALTLLRDHGVMVIDRDQFAQLIDPKRDLSDCVGLCAAEIAREIGAHWSLSGSLANDGKTAMITLKLHNASGALLAVEQSRGALIKLTQDQLVPMTERLITVGLFTDEDESDTDEINEEHSADLPQDEAILKAKTLPTEDRIWHIVSTERGQVCMSPLVTIGEYQNCVQAGVCTDRATWGRCEAQNEAPVRCIDLKQALTFSRWRQAWLPSLKEWQALMTQARFTTSLFEWVIPDQAKSSREVAEWRSQYLNMDHQTLKRSPPIDVVRSSIQGRSRQIGRRRAPPSFKVPDLSFRVITADLQKCAGR